MREEDKEAIFRRERSDPIEGDRPWPLGIWILVLVMSSFACGYLLLFSGDGSLGGGDLRRHAAPMLTGAGSAAGAVEEPAGEVDVMALGQRVYQSACVACHQSSGAGLAGAFPPLDGSSWVTGDPAVPANIVLGGMMGPIEVKGVAYNGVMPAFAAQLDDQEIAAVVSYVRGSWSNAAAAITPETVAELRAASAGRGPWTANELRP